MYPKKKDDTQRDSLEKYFGDIRFDEGFNQCHDHFTQEIKKRAEESERYFEKLRFDETNHLGMGDIRLTIGQQDKIIKNITKGLEK